MPVYAATIFLSAFLLFQIQPMIAKFILPWFGGSAAVWSAALLFFQLVLLGGYLYAHLLIRHLRRAWQFRVHTALLIASLATLPIIPSATWKPSSGADPTLRILLLLLVTIGLPYGLLSATSPLLQAWYVRTHAGAMPYRLFALSNFGSMLALLSYPFLVEPRLALSKQAWVWSIAYGAFAAVCIVAGWKSRSATATESAPQGAPAPGLAQRLLWIGLSACASILLLAVTSHMTQNVAPIPLLWIVPLSLYLLSFILCFESPRFYLRVVFLPLLPISLFFLAQGDRWYRNNAEVTKLVPALCGALFICCMVCHGELARQRPHPRYLTQFYLMVSTGGALGGFFVALAAPRLFHSYVELPFGMALCAFLVGWILWKQVSSTPVRAALALSVVAFTAYLVHVQLIDARDYIFSARNFYGVLRVADYPGKDGHSPVRMLVHGTINHGTQLLRPTGGRIATSYFGENAGIHRAIAQMGERGPLRIGVLGLGAGVTATLARAGDTLHYYEINPLVVSIAQTKFDFWRACPAEKRLYSGDGRLVLESLPDEHLDVLVMDAFTGDAVPVHLLAAEAFSTYLRHMNPGGVLAVNITNRYLDLAPVVAEAAAAPGMTGVIVTDDGMEESYYSGSDWALITRDPALFAGKRFEDKYAVSPLKRRKGFRAWTDDYSNIVQILQ